MKKVILTGNPDEVDKVMRENRIRVERKLISFKEIVNEETNEEEKPKKSTVGRPVKGSSEI